MYSGFVVQERLAFNHKFNQINGCINLESIELKINGINGPAK